MRQNILNWNCFLECFQEVIALVAVIVSGLDADGAEALREIKEAGGITIAQTPDTAEWSDMPESAIKTGYIDFVLSVEDIAQKIAEIAKAFQGNAT